MKNIVLKIFILIFCMALIGWSLLPFKEDFFSTKPLPEYMEQQKDSLTRELLFEDEEIEKEARAADSLAKHLKEKSTKLTQLKIEYEEKTNVIKHTTDVELLEFFTNFNTKSTVH